MSALKLNLFEAIDFFIQVKEGPEKGKVYRFGPPRISIGRDDSNQIILQDPRVSRQQCSISFGQDIICEDLTGKGTTLLNGKVCHKAKLKPGDIISIGDTQLMFFTKAKANQQAELPGQVQAPQSSNEEGRKRFQFFMIAILVLAGALFLLQEESINSNPKTLLTQEDVRKQIEESQERQNLIRDSEDTTRVKPHSDKYLYDVEKHFITGFRDFQNGQYGRAIDSFGTTIATDQQHVRAYQYARTAKKKRSDLIDTHMRDGSRYREKMMYNRCAAEFEKAIILINNVNSDRFDLARTQLKECRLLQAGGSK